MRELEINENGSGKRLDKYCSQYLQNAPSGFVYKMLRKKNITLNGKKASGSEKLVPGDVIKLFFSEETITKFGNQAVRDKEGSSNEYLKAYSSIKNIIIVHEDDNIILVNKPAGVLSQKAEISDCSLNEWLIGYLLETGAVSTDSLVSFRPSICNRIDRNTSGLVICAKTLAGARQMAVILKDRSIHKYYRTIVSGIADKPYHGTALMSEKDTDRNMVSVKKSNKNSGTDSNEHMISVETAFVPLAVNRHDNLSYLEVELITGKTHQIRAHLSSLGFPLVGDRKYGTKTINDIYEKKFHIHSQMLHSYRIEFPQMPEPFADISGKSFIAEIPDKMNNLIAEIMHPINS